MSAQNIVSSMVFGFVVVLCLSTAVSASAALITETFDTQQSADDHGWTQSGNGDGGQIIGFSNTNVAGGDAGEGRALFYKTTTRPYYADTDLGGTLPLDAPFSASGKFDVAGQFEPDTGAFLGFFNPLDNSQFGIIFTDINTTEQTWGLRILTPDGVTQRTTVLNTSHIITPNTDRTFNIEWDPNGGSGESPDGMFSATISGAGDPWTIELTSAERAILDSAGFALNAFGLNKPASGVTRNKWVDFRIDDLTYSVVPEPGSLVLFITGALGLIMWCLRRRD